MLALFPKCKHCGKRTAPTKAGRLRAHKCPHGQQCAGRVRRTSDGFRRDKVVRCMQCFESRQLALPFEEPPPSRELTLVPDPEDELVELEERDQGQGET
jgi:hypothetical protein